MYQCSIRALTPCGINRPQCVKFLTNRMQRNRDIGLGPNNFDQFYLSYYNFHQVVCHLCRASENLHILNCHILATNSTQTTICYMILKYTPPNKYLGQFWPQVLWPLFWRFLAKHCQLTLTYQPLRLALLWGACPALWISTIGSEFKKTLYISCRVVYAYTNSYWYTAWTTTSVQNFTVLSFVTVIIASVSLCHILANILPGARPTKHISIEFEIRWKFKTL